MPVAVALFAALAVLLGVLLALSQRRIRAERAQSAAEIERRRAEGDELRTRLAEATGTAEADRARAAGELAEARTAAGAAQARADGAEAERDAARHDRDEVRARAERLEQALAAERAGGAPDRNAALWALEVARSERTWRHSVAPLPMGPSPFPEAEDTLGLAVEVEAAALREEVGAPLEVRWDATVDDVAARILTLRVAQELLAAAARDGLSAVLTVTGDGDDVILHLTGTEDEDEPVRVPAPELPDGLATVDHDDDGVRVVLHLL